MIVIVGGIKGGCGKSLISTNLTVMRSLTKGKKVLLVDADEQGTSGDWTTIRLRANAVRSEVLKLSKDYDDVIIDCGGRDTTSLRAALTVADTFLVPFQPKSFDIWTVTKVAALVEEAKCVNEKLVSYAFINCGCSRGSDNEDARDILAQAKELQLLPVTIGLRKAFSNATADGKGIVEMSGDIKAVDEMKLLHKSIFGSL